MVLLDISPVVGGQTAYQQYRMTARIVNKNPLPSPPSVHAKVLRRSGGGAGRGGARALGHSQLQQELPDPSGAGAARGGGRDHSVELPPLHGGQQGRRRPRRRLHRGPVRLFDTLQFPVVVVVVLVFVSGWGASVDCTLEMSVPYTNTVYCSIPVQLPAQSQAPGLFATHVLAPSLSLLPSLSRKPSELAPSTCVRMAGLAEAAGFPPGALNVVTGEGFPTGDALSRHPGLDKVSFTGSVPTGQK